ncbi:MAG: hypothetical protein C0404_05590 [Verrucomicrobia bacterium]|nr:hypothetical protein [Verrucomicrobiota bacterium]
MIQALHNVDVGECSGTATRASTMFWTAGYEQTTPDRFLNALSRTGIEIVVDVRKTPLSRKKGFSKNQLREALSKSGIHYVHVESLGAPKEIRDRLHDGGSWWEYVKSYEKLLQSRHAEVLDLVELASSQRACLLCFERDASACHRSLVAREMVRLDNGRRMEVSHIQV